MGVLYRLNHVRCSTIVFSLIGTTMTLICQALNDEFRYIHMLSDLTPKNIIILQWIKIISTHIEDDWERRISNEKYSETQFMSKYQRNMKWNLRGWTIKVRHCYCVIKLWVVLSISFLRASGNYVTLKITFFIPSPLVSLFVWNDFFSRNAFLNSSGPYIISECSLHKLGKK